MELNILFEILRFLFGKETWYYDKKLEMTRVKELKLKLDVVLSLKRVITNNHFILFSYILENNSPRDNHVWFCGCFCRDIFYPN